MLKGAAFTQGAKSIVDRLAGVSNRPTFDESTYSSRSLQRRPWPVRSSARPCPYMGAVSKKRTPASQASSNMDCDVSSSISRKMLPSGAVPNPNAVTSRSTRPNFRFSPGCIRKSPHVSNWMVHNTRGDDQCASLVVVRSAIFRLDRLPHADICNWIVTECGISLCI